MAVCYAATELVHSVQVQAQAGSCLLDQLDPLLNQVCWLFYRPCGRLNVGKATYHPGLVLDCPVGSREAPAFWTADGEVRARGLGMLVGGGAVLVQWEGQLVEGAPHMQSQQQAVGLLLIDPSDVSRVRG